MSTSARYGARGPLDAARPAVARLDATRGSEDLAADLIEAWDAVENALRALVGAGASLSGQALIREARQRQLINFDQANALAEFQATRARLDQTSYRPTDADVNAARTAFLKLDAALMGDGAVDGPPHAAPGAGATRPAVVGVSESPAIVTEPVVAPVRRVPAWAALVGAAVILVILLGGGYWLIAGRHTSASLDQGITYWKSGQREAAVASFNKAVRENPKDPLPHVYLARMAREVGNFSLAGQELQLALQDDPGNHYALREMGATLLAQGNYELARRFYVRAVEADAADTTAMGYLGCTLMRLGRTAEAPKFLNRAGPGPWSNCTPAAATGAGAQASTQPGLLTAPGPIPGPATTTQSVPRRP